MSDQSKAQAVVLGNLALALIRQGKPDEAAGRLHQAMDVIQLNWGAAGLNLTFSAGRELRSSSSRTCPAPLQLASSGEISGTSAAVMPPSC